MKTKIMVVDDDPNIRELVRLYLEKEGFEVTCAERGDEAVKVFRASPPNLMLLDVMLPGMDGWEVLDKLRQESDVPVIMLTAKGDTLDRIQGLDLGADDYIVKPFDAKELLARIKAVLRRSSLPENEKCVTFEDLEISLDNYSVTLDGKQIEMPPRRSSSCFSWPPGRARCLPGNSCWNRCGASTSLGIPAPWTCMSSAFGKSWGSGTPGS